MFLIFFIVGILVTYYAAGFRFSVKNLKPIHVGALSISSDPDNALIYIDGKQSDKGTPTLILNILPGMHTITVTAPGFSTWEKQLETFASTTTFVNNIILFRSAPTPQILSVGGNSLIKSNDNSLYIFLDARSNIHVTNTVSNRTYVITASVKPTELLSLSPSKEYVLMKNAEGLYALAITTEKIISIPRSIIVSATDIAWERSGYPILWFLQKRQLKTFDLTDKTISKPLFNDVDNFFLSENTVTTLQLEKNQTHVLNYSFGSHALRWSRVIPSTENLTIADINNDDRVTLKGNHDLWLVSGTGTQSTRVFDAQYARWQGNTLLYANENEISSYNAATQEEKLIDRSTHSIYDIQWFPGGLYFMRYRDDGIALVEFDDRDKRNIALITEPSEPVTMLFDKTGSKLFLISSSTNSFEKIR